MSSKDYFAGKRVAVVGLGADGQTAAEAKYLVKARAMVSVYDMRSEGRVGADMAFLRSLGLAGHSTGSVPAEDLADADLIILSQEYGRDAVFLEPAKAAGVPIERPETLFLKLAPPITVAAVMGPFGKASTASMLYPMLEAAWAGASQSVFMLDPETGDGILPALKKMKNGDAAVLRLSGAVMPEVAALDWSPYIAVFTAEPQAGSFARSPFEILERQTYNNAVIGSDAVIDAVRHSGVRSKARMLRTKASQVPEGWLRRGRGQHDLENAALALQAAGAFKVPESAARDALEAWKPLYARLEPVKKIRGVEFVNDAASVSPGSVEAAMKALVGTGEGENRKLVVIIGGADGGSDYSGLHASLPKYAHTVVTVPGSGTLKERRAIRAHDGLAVISAPSLEEAVRSAMDAARKGDAVLYSPGFPPGGIDQSRRARGERFVRAVRGL